MFNKIKNRLILLIFIVLITFIAIIVRIKTKEISVFDTVLKENSILLRRQLFNQIVSEFDKNKFNQKFDITQKEKSNPDSIIVLNEKQIKNINEEFIYKISSSLDANVKIISTKEIDKLNINFQKYPFIIYSILYIYNDLHELNKVILAYREEQVLRSKYLEIYKDNFSLIIVLLIIFSILIVGLHSQVISPITHIISSLKQNNLDKLRKFIGKTSEFGIVTNVIIEFFNQKKKLEEEISIRKITQEELETINEQLEKRVEERTIELATTNLELQKERDQSKKYLDIAGTIIALLDRNGFIEMINKKGYEVLGYLPGELLGKNWYDICIEESSRKIYKEYHQDVIMKKVQPSEFLIIDVITKNKETRTLIFHNTFLNDVNGEFTSVLFSAEDITELKSKEKELIEAKERADEANKLKSAFLANMSHELRTPMIGILGFSDLLMNELTDESHKKMASTIYESGQRLIDTLNMILDLSRLEANKHNIDYQFVDLNDLVKNVSFYFLAAAQKKSLFIKTSIPSTIIYSNTDPRMVRDVMNNLINNAIKFTHSGGIYITLSKNAGYFKISVKDTGIGIPEDSIEVIFDEFKQLSEGLGRKFQGTGLGLSICKKYIELLNGKIYVESKPDEGSEFIFEIPLNINEKSEINNNEWVEDKNQNLNINPTYQNVDLKNELKRASILVVEDDDTSREVIRLFLEKLYNLTFASNGDDAINFAKIKKFDLIMMDINLGVGMSGIEVKEKIRSIEGYKNIPIIAVTAFAMIGDRDKLISAGFDNYISKPYLKQDLLKLLEDSLICCE